MPEAPLVSVVVPVRDGAGYLPTLFDGLAAQTLPADRFETILVDDASTDATLDLASAWAAGEPARRHVVVGPGRGPASARNAGIARARGAWIASTDCDVVPDPRWLEAALERAAETGAQAVEGAIAPLSSDSPPGYALRQVNDGGGRFMTGNMLYRRDLVERLGGFDEELEYFLEDSDLAFRMLDAGVEIPFAPAAIVFHPVVEFPPRVLLRRSARLVWLPLMVAKHPARYRSQLRPYVRPLSGTELDLLVGLAAGASALRARGLPRATLLAVAAHGLRRGLGARQVLAGPIEEAPARAALAVAVPVVKVCAVAIGCLRYRKAIW